MIPFEGRNVSPAFDFQSRGWRLGEERGNTTSCSCGLKICMAASPTLASPSCSTHSADVGCTPRACKKPGVTRKKNWLMEEVFFSLWDYLQHSRAEEDLKVSALCSRVRRSQRGGRRTTRSIATLVRGVWRCAFLFEHLMEQSKGCLLFRHMLR